LNYREIKGNFGAICISELTQTNHLQVLCKVQFYISGIFLYTHNSCNATPFVMTFQLLQRSTFGGYLHSRPY